MRWDSLTLENEITRQLPGYREPATVRTFDAPEALNTRFYEVRAKSALNKVGAKSPVPFGWSVNPYRGCTHACTYCFARPTHTYLDLDAGRDFEREIIVKINAPERLRAELSRPSWNHEHVALGTNTDPYQWVEGRYRLMPGIWQALLDTHTPCSLLTKSPLLLRDIDLLKKLAKTVGFTAALSVPTLDEKAWRASEPRTPNPRARLEAVAELNRSGVPTSILVAPLMPGVNDAPEQVERILQLAAESGATSVIGLALHLRGEVKDVFMEWLSSYRSDLVPRYEQLYGSRAYLSTAERKRIAGVVWDAKRAVGYTGKRRVRRWRQQPDRLDGGNSPTQSLEVEHAQQSLFG